MENEFLEINGKLDMLIDSLNKDNINCFDSDEIEDFLIKLISKRNLFDDYKDAILLNVKTIEKAMNSHLLNAEEYEIHLRKILCLLIHTLSSQQLSKEEILNYYSNVGSDLATKDMLIKGIENVRKNMQSKDNVVMEYENDLKKEYDRKEELTERINKDNKDLGNTYLLQQTDIFILQLNYALKPFYILRLHRKLFLFFLLIIQAKYRSEKGN